MPQRHRGRRSHRKASESLNLSEAKVHITKAGHELLLAAEGLLNFCKSYVEQKSAERPYRNWIRSVTKALITFKSSKAYAVMSDLGITVMNSAPVKQATEKIGNLKIY
jgi:hypothetical protein